MSIYYHGTNSKEKILKNGFKILSKVVNGKHFGTALYFAPSIKDASCYGDQIVTVEINDDILLPIDGMDNFNALALKFLCAGGEKQYLEANGYKGFKLKEIDNSYIVVLYDESVVKIVS